MKVYVDEQPESCLDCKFCNKENYCCWLLQKDVREYRDECPLQSLADHTKQVRKEMLGELMNMLGDRAELIDIGNGCVEFMFTTYDLQECSKEILDTIQGETNE